MSKRILSLVLAFVMVLGTFGTVFAEVAGPTSNDKVNKLIELGLVKGDGNDYRLSDSIRRDEVAAMVVRSMDLESVANAMINVPTKFADVKAGEWNNGYVSVAEGQGIVKGTGGVNFEPAKPITYQEVAAMLVRVIGLDPKVEATFSWPASYVAEAHKLGILADVEISSMAGAATRENVFEMVFNTINNKNANLLVANTIEGIVVENYRTENLNKDEIIVHVMKDQVQKSENKYYEQGDEFRVVLNAELKKAGHDVETLLGKVVTVSLDKEDKVIGIKVNTDYQYLQGSLTEVKSNELRLGGKWYTVEKNEARIDTDERLYQVYYNNTDVNYVGTDSFTSIATGAEYAKITVRNGKVLFIDAFAFDDIAPVAKEADSKDRVSFYDDSKDGAVNTIVIDETANIVLFENKEMKLGNHEEIAMNDVIHWFYEYEGTRNEELTVFVRPSADNKVEGVYGEANSAKAKEEADIKIEIEKVEYPAKIDTFEDGDNRDAVYSTVASTMEFYTLTEDYDDELAPFEKEEVIVLRDMFNNVQLISAEQVDGRFYAVISDLYNYDFRLVNVKNDNTWYDSDRATKFYGVDGSTREQQINEFDQKDLVLASATEELLTKLTKIEADHTGVIEKINRDVVSFGGENYYYTAKNTVVFDVQGKTPKAMTVAEFIKNYDTTKSIEGYVVENGKDAKLVDVIVITEATAKDNIKYDTLTVKVTRVRFSGETYRLDVVNSDEETATYYVPANNKSVNDDPFDLVVGNKVVKGSVIEITVPKEADKDGNKTIKTMEEILDENNDVAGVFEVVELGRDRARNEEYMVLKDANGVSKTVWVSRLASKFGSYKVGNFVAINQVDDYMVTDIVDVRSAKKATAVWTTEDQIAADEVIELVEALEVVSLEDKEAVVAARTAYDALTEAQKALVPAEVVALLTAAETKIAELETPKEVTAKITEIKTDDPMIAMTTIYVELENAVEGKEYTVRVDGIEVPFNAGVYKLVVESADEIATKAIADIVVVVVEK